MLNSMTGYGQGELRVEGSGKGVSYTVRVEVRTVNNRFLSIKTRLPEGCQALMSPVEKVLRDRLSRGSVHVAVTLRADSSDPRSLIDTELLDAYSRALDKIQRERGEGRASLDTLLGLPDVVRSNGVVPPAAEELEGRTLEVLSDALDQLVAMRCTEGQHLQAVIEETLSEVDRHLAAVRARAGSVVEDYRQRLRTRLEAILAEEGMGLADADIIREVAIYADRGDISEELARMDSHVSQLRACLRESGPVGKKMEFITQEMFREVNTILAKVNDPELSEAALSIKTSVEKTKEQALNVE